MINRVNKRSLLIQQSIIAKNDVNQKRIQIAERLRTNYPNYTQRVENFDPMQTHSPIINSSGDFVTDKITISTWNINGARANETRIDERSMTSDFMKLVPQNYISFWDYCKPPHYGYSGSGILTKYSPLNVRYGIGIPEHDTEGRVVTLEFPYFYLVCIYAPNSMDDLRRLEYRVFEWDVAFREYCKSLLHTSKQIVIAGDFNVAHCDIDIHNSKKSIWYSGFTFYERSSFTQFLKSGFKDTFREKHPHKIKYTWWSNRCKPVDKNGDLMKDRTKGKRVDYILVNDSLISAVDQVNIPYENFGSDHCPVSIQLNLSKMKEIIK